MSRLPALEPIGTVHTRYTTRAATPGRTHRHPCAGTTPVAADVQ